MLSCADAKAPRREPPIALAIRPVETADEAPVKRKIAAILAADIAGFSKLVAEDEEETLRRLAGYRAVFADFVARCGGRIFNTAGDGVLSEFPSAVDAVRCALDIQESIRARNLAYPPSREMAFRVGITVADVVERDGDLLGDGVNVAARLGDIAPPGGICVSRTVYEQVAAKLSVKFDDMGERRVKNIPGPIHAYAIPPHPAGGERTEPGQQATPTGRRKWLAGAIAAGLATGAALVLVLKLTEMKQAATAEGAPVAASANRPGARAPIFDEEKVRAFAAARKIPLPPSLKVMAPAPALSPSAAAYLGAWGGDERWNGTGRQTLLIIETIDPDGTTLGVLGFGPPAGPNLPDQRPARYRSIAGSITEEGAVFDVAGTRFTFKSISDGLMWGHQHGPGEHGPFDMTITIERIESGGQKSEIGSQK
jgi:class 3 adenylate cyclase